LEPPIVTPTKGSATTIDIRFGISREVHTYEYRTGTTVNDTKIDQATVFSEFWALSDVTTDAFFKTSDLVLVVFSSQIPLFFAGVASTGVIALYIGVVFAVGRLLRGVFGGLHTQLQWYFLEDTKPLFALVESVVWARRFHLLQNDKDFQSLITRSK
jgi:hypothetical protein